MIDRSIAEIIYLQIKKKRKEKIRKEKRRKALFTVSSVSFDFNFRIILENLLQFIKNYAGKYFKMYKVFSV